MARERGTAYLGEVRVILINSIGGRDDGAFLRLLHGDSASLTLPRLARDPSCCFARLIRDIPSALPLSFPRRALIKTPGRLMGRVSFAAAYTTRLCVRANRKREIKRCTVSRLICARGYCDRAYRIGDESICARVTEL